MSTIITMLCLIVVTAVMLWPSRREPEEPADEWERVSREGIARILEVIEEARRERPSLMVRVLNEQCPWCETYRDALFAAAALWPLCGDRMPEAAMTLLRLGREFERGIEEAATWTGRH